MRMVYVLNLLTVLHLSLQSPFDTAGVLIHALSKSAQFMLVIFHHLHSLWILENNIAVKLCWLHFWVFALDIKTLCRVCKLSVVNINFTFLPGSMMLAKAPRVNDQLSATINNRTLYLSDWRRKLITYNSKRKIVSTYDSTSYIDHRTLASTERNEVNVPVPEYRECRTLLRTVGRALQTSYSRVLSPQLPCLC